MTYFHIPDDIERDKEGNPIKPNPLFIYQNKPMTIREYLESKEIKPKELKEHFQLVRTFEADIYGMNGCFNCGDKPNAYALRSPAWTNAMRCNKCESISIAYIQDRMGGIHTDTIEVFKEKQLKP